MNPSFLSLQASVYIMLGGAIGAWLRITLIQYFAPLVPQLPLGMIFVNILGSFIIGALYLPLMDIQYAWLKYVVVGGFLGALTTFSTFALDIFLLWDSRKYAIAVTIGILVPILSILAVFAGAYLYKALKGQ